MTDAALTGLTVGIVLGWVLCLLDQRWQRAIEATRPGGNDCDDGAVPARYREQSEARYREGTAVAGEVFHADCDDGDQRTEPAQ